MGLLDFLGMGKKPDLPSYYTDPFYTSSQEYLDKFGTDMMGGNIPDYYKAIGESGSPEFENILRMAVRNTQRAGTEDAARRGVRGGAATSAISKSVADLTGGLRYQDYMNAISGKKFLLGTGVGVKEGVRNAAAGTMGARNTFNQNQYQYQYADYANDQQALSDLIGGVVGMGTNIYGIKTLARSIENMGPGGTYRTTPDSILGGGELYKPNTIDYDYWLNKGRMN